MSSQNYKPYSYKTPRSLRFHGRRCFGDRTLCRRVLETLELAPRIAGSHEPSGGFIPAVRHVDGCRDCRLEIAQRAGLGWQIAGELARAASRTAILGVPVAI